MTVYLLLAFALVTPSITTLPMVIDRWQSFAYPYCVVAVTACKARTKKITPVTQINK